MNSILEFCLSPNESKDSFCENPGILTYLKTDETLIKILISL